MRKRVVVLFLVLALGFSLFAGPSANLYDLVVPEEYTYLYLGSLNWTTFPRRSTNNLVELNFNFNPSSFSMALGMDGEYRWYRQTLDSDLNIPADAFIEITDTNFALYLDTNPSYRSYTLDLEGFPGFWGAGVEVFKFQTSVPFSGTSSVSAQLYPYGEIGIGRTYSINTLKKIEKIMQHMGVTPTEDGIRKVAEILYKEPQILNEFSNDTSEVYLRYFESIAEALGVPNRVPELILINYSQIYDFNVARYRQLRQGWYVAARLVPGLYKTFASTSAEFDGKVKFLGEYGDFLIEDTLHLKANGDIVLGLDTGASPMFHSEVGVSGLVTYLPENYRWWANGTVSLNFDTQNSPMVSFDLNARLNYLINPNFSVYGGASFYLGDTTVKTEKLSVFAGGQIRIW